MLSKIDTYIVFGTTEHGDIILLSPCFQEEIKDLIKDGKKNGIKNIQVLKEELFKQLHQEEYLIDKTIYWTEFVSTLIDSFVELELMYEYNDLSIENELFCLFQEGDRLLLYFHISCPLLIASILTQEFQVYLQDVFEIEIKNIYTTQYFDKKQKVYLGAEAYLKNLTEVNLN